MVQVSRSIRLYRKAEAAFIASIEAYNKPDFAYREETFAILHVNAWELLLKARLLALKNNSPTALYVYERRRTKTGELSKKQYVKRNRCGNEQTLGIQQVMSTLAETTGGRLNPAVNANLNALLEIRDNAVHYYNPSGPLARRVLEVGAASVKNFVALSQRWFGDGLDRYNLYLMPLGLVSSPQLEAAPIATDEANLLEYLRRVIADEGESGGSDYHVALEVSLAFKRAARESEGAVPVTTGPNGIQVTMTEEDIRLKYPWDYAEVLSRCRSRYIDMKQNQRFNGIMQQLKSDTRYCRQRFLDPGNPRSAKKDFYNSNIVQELDRHYTRASDTAA